MGHKPRVFLSHASEDRGTVRRIHDSLARHGCDPWMDSRVLLPGQSWELEIHEAIEASDFFVACLSTVSVNKIGYVQREFELGLQEQKHYPQGAVFVIPLRLDDCPIPPAFASKHVLDWFASEAPARLLQVLHPTLHAPEVLMERVERLNHDNDAVKKLAALELAQDADPLALLILSERYYHAPALR